VSGLPIETISSRILAGVIVNGRPPVRPGARAEARRGPRLLETAVRDELIASNPAARVKRQGVPRTEAHYLSIAEVTSLRDSVKDSSCAPLVRLLDATGLRRGEAPPCAGRTSTSPTAFRGPWHALTSGRAPGHQ
jgi:integrase